MVQSEARPVESDASVVSRSHMAGSTERRLATHAHAVPEWHSAIAVRLRSARLLRAHADNMIEVRLQDDNVGDATKAM